jgi:acetyl esterase/lipase
MARGLVTAAIALALLAPARAAASDLVVPAVGHERGVILFIHGGGWMSGSPASELANARAFAHAGWRGISVDYPLLDIDASYRSVEQHAATMRLPGEPLYAIGSSAGATMAEWLAARGLVDAAIGVDGPSDLTTWRAVKPGGPLAAVPVLVSGFALHGWQLSPARVYSPRSRPLMVVSAADDALVETEQAMLMQRRGAVLDQVPGGHLVSRSWRRPGAAFLRSATRR